MFYDLIRIAKHHNPKILFLENVKNVISHSGGTTIKIMLNILNDIGYDVHLKSLKASDFGVPQVRERVYFVCFRKDLKIHFNFPENKCNPVHLIDFLEKNIKPKLITKYIPQYKSEINLQELQKNKSDKPIQIGFVHYGGQGDRIYSPFGQAVTISASGGGNFSKTGGYYIDGYPRRLTPRECANIMGFPKNFILHENDNVARKQFGNSVVVPVLKEIFKNIILTNVFK